MIETGLEVWEYGTLNIDNPNTSPLKPYYEIILEKQFVSGPVLELGVATGKSLLTTALILKFYGIEKKVYGYDTFEGFPDFSPEDDLSTFEYLYSKNMISEKHYFDFKKNLSHLNLKQSKLTPRNISSSGDFSGTTITEIFMKANHIGVADLIELNQVDLSRNFSLDVFPSSHSVAIIDLDLYTGYRNTLPTLWERLSPGGAIYLDEYYSLKFPGPRLAVDEFLQVSDANLHLLGTWLDFERWILAKKTVGSNV
jgi:hypothetical protein